MLSADMSVGYSSTFSVYGTVSFVPGIRALPRMKNTLRGIRSTGSFRRTQVNPAVLQYSSFPNIRIVNP
jgi:hypothetical protein